MIRSILFGMVFALLFASSGCGNARGSGVTISPLTAQDGTPCLVLYQDGEARGLSCR